MTPYMQAEKISGWMDFQDHYSYLVDNIEAGTIVEVGNYLGKSLCYLGDLVRQAGKNIHVVGVDIGTGSGEENGEDHHKEAVRTGGGTLVGTLHRNVLRCSLQDIITLITAPSVRAASLFALNSVDAVFLDGSHEYESVKADIEAWLPIVKPGGILSGDDLTTHWKGVVKAVEELLPLATPTSFDSWLYRKPLSE